MQIRAVIKKQKPVHLITVAIADEARTQGIDVEQPCELEFVSCQRVNSDLPDMPPLTARKDPEGASFSLLDPEGGVVAFYVINQELARITFDHCLGSLDDEFEIIFDLKQKEAASE